jgi:hypothetical protein
MFFFLQFCTNLQVGNPLSKDFVTRVSEGTLRGEGEVGRVLDLRNASSYWKNNRERIESQQVVWLPPDSLPPTARKAKGKRVGAVVPQMVVAGTLTRRAVERTWLTASNADEHRIGSELRAMVHAPHGYHIVGADVDSQVCSLRVTLTRDLAIDCLLPEIALCFDRLAKSCRFLFSITCLPVFST